MAALVAFNAFKEGHRRHCETLTGVLLAFME